VRPAIRRWNGARVAEAVGADGVWRNVRHFLHQAVFDTTVNLASSETASRLLRDDEPLRPPLTFFINRDVLFDALGLEPEDGTVSDISIEGRLYRQCLTRYDVHRTDGNIRIDGDAHFAFLVPEPAFEDTHLVEALLQAGLVSERFVASLAMTDFSNPIFSPPGRRCSAMCPNRRPGRDPATTWKADSLPRSAPPFPRGGMAPAILLVPSGNSCPIGIRPIIRWSLSEG
jgi:hypothetical protein